VGGIPPAEPSQFRSDIFKQTPPVGKSGVVNKPSVQTMAKIAKVLSVLAEDLIK
jgi:hypothetical protein